MKVEKPKSVIVPEREDHNYILPRLVKQML